MEITHVSEADLDELSALYQQLIPNDVSIAAMQRVVRNNDNNRNHIVLCARVGGKLVGSLLAVICEMLFGQCKSFMVIEDVVVDSGCRRRGVGQAFMQYIEKYAKERNCSYIMLITDSDRVGSQDFYRSLGYNSDEYKAFKKHL